MVRTPTPAIRKLTCGENPRDFAMAFQVGSPVGKTGYVISDIVEDVNQFFLFGNIRFLIYLKYKNENFLWKAIESVPVVIEYFLPDGKEENIV